MQSGGDAHQYVARDQKEMKKGGMMMPAKKGGSGCFKVHHFGKDLLQADASEMLLCHAGVKYETCVIARPDFMAKGMDKQFPGGTLPALECPDGTKIGKSTNMLRFLGQKYCYYPRDPLAATQVDFIVECFKDLIEEIIMALPHLCPDEAKREEQICKIFDTCIPKFMDKFNKVYNPECLYLVCN